MVLFTEARLAGRRVSVTGSVFWSEMKRGYFLGVVSDLSHQGKSARRSFDILTQRSRSEKIVQGRPDVNQAENH